MIFLALALLFMALFLMDGFAAKAVNRISVGLLHRRGFYLRRRRGRQVKCIRATVPDYPGRFGLDVRIR